MILRDLFEEDHEGAHYDALARTGFYGAQGAGCIFLARSTGRILINHRSKDVEQPHTWGTWGGAVNPGESPEAAVRREVREEAGYHGQYDLVPLFVFQSGTFRYSNFLVEVQDEFDPVLDWESEGYAWCDLNDLPHPIHFGLASLLSDPASMAKIKAAQREVDESVGAISAISPMSMPMTRVPPLFAEAYREGVRWAHAHKGASYAMRMNNCPYSEGDTNRIWWFKGSTNG